MTVAPAIDAHLGPGYRAAAQELEHRYGTAKSSVQVARDHFEVRGLLTDVLVSIFRQIDKDTRALEKIRSDYRAGLALIESGQPVDKAQVDEVYGLYSLALGVVEEELQALRDMQGMAFAGGIFTGILYLVEKQAVHLKELLEKLEEELVAARRDIHEAYAQTVLNLVIGAVHLALPHLGLLSRSTLWVGQVVVDYWAGPHKSALEEVGVVGIHAVGAFGESVDKIKKLGHKRVGKGVLVLGVVFDLNEISHAREKHERLSVLVEKVQRQAENFARELDGPRMARLRDALPKLAAAISHVRDNPAVTREALEADIRKARYSLDRSLTWKVER